MKIYKAFSAYKKYLRNFYSDNPSLLLLPYEKQADALKNDGFPWIFSWSTNNPYDDIEIFETVHNCAHLQKSWKKHTDLNTDWDLEIVIDQIKTFRPDICVLYPPELFTQEVLDRINSVLPKKCFFVGYDGMKRDNHLLYSGYDLVITCSDFISNYYKQFGLNTYTLPFGFDPEILDRIDSTKSPKFNVGFSGSIFSNSHNERFKMLAYLTKYLKIEIRSDFGGLYRHPYFSRKQLKRLLNDFDLHGFMANGRINSMNKGSLYGLEMYQFLNDSKISLNLHGDKIEFAANVRLFEATGVGSCLLTDWKQNIAEIFVPDKEIVTFSSNEEAKDKIKFLLKNEKTRTRIARAGQRRTLSEYSNKKIIPELLDYLRKQFAH